MNVEISAKQVNGTIEILSSKSELHRMIILACLKKSQTRIFYSGKASEDVNATVDCMRKIGVLIKEENNCFTVVPPQKFIKNGVEINVKESGSTLRFLLPVFSALGISYVVHTEGRLSLRPLSPLYELMQENGVTLGKNGVYPMSVSGLLLGNKYEIDGGVSSQFITGLLLSLVAKNKGGSITVTGKFESKPYVDLTVDVMKKMGINVLSSGNSYEVQPYADDEDMQIKAGGDWSNGAFFACMGAVSGKISVTGIDLESKQGDKKVLDILQRMGAKITKSENAFTVENAPLFATDIDAKDVPDIIPPLACVCALSYGVSRIYNAQRLKIKESDRIKSVVNMLKVVGVKVEEKEDGMIIYGKSLLNSGTVDGAGDHRIVMSCAILALKANGKIMINGAHAVKKSYPQFFEEIYKLGYKVKEV